MPRQVEGSALLIAGHGAPGVGAFDASVVHTLGQIGEALRATGSPWHVRRLTATLGDRYTADRKTIKRSLAALIDDPVRVGVVVLLGEIIEVANELALVTGAEAHDYPEDATLPLSWIRGRLSNAKAERVVVAMSARGKGTPERWLGALGTQHAAHVVAIDAPTQGNPMIDALLAGLCGDALDRQTGTVTMASLSAHLASHTRVIQTSSVGETIAQPPPLAGFWDVRQSQRARPRARREGAAEDLTGVVLPGRFRIDKLVARGTFGTVYRARQLAVERDVAIKVLHADIDPASGDGKLFVEEIRAVGRIDHANVVRIYQADITHDGRLFFAMEHLDGQDLQTIGIAERIPQDRAVELVRQLLAGLNSAHEAGLVHADIKPANAIVVSPRSGHDASASISRERAVLVDFGLARLRPANQPAESVGGTPAYMAPEQLHEGRVDARSDLFSVALVLVWLLTGWRRPNAATLVPPVNDLIEDTHLCEVLIKALDSDPANRFQTARELAAALVGNPAPMATRPSQEIRPVLPFRHLAPLTEADRGRLHGREADVAQITEHALYRRVVVYAAPSGSGKTSVLCAGLLPRLEALGIHAVYIRCRTDFMWSVVKAIAPGATSIADAITKFHENRGGKLVIVVDQLEAALADPEFVPALLGFDRWPTGADVSIVLAIREDWLARLLARTQEIEPNLPIVRLPPLSPEGARTAIVAPLAEHRLGIEPALLDALLEDLQTAAAAIGPEMGWGDEPAVFPPHLQLACSVLYESMAAGATELTLETYQKLGRFDAIVGEHLDNVIENQLADGRDLIARDIFLALVTSAHQRSIRPEAELLSIVGAKHGGAGHVLAVLEILGARGLLVRVRGDGEASWELVHDSLVARVLAWIDRRDLARRRAIELLRQHVRHSNDNVGPSLLGRKELRELAAHEGAVAELDAEYAKRATKDSWTPSSLVARSRSVWRRTATMIVSVIVVALAVGAFSFYRYRVEAAHTVEQQRLKALDLGRFELVLELIEWDATAKPKPVAAEAIHWKLHTPDRADPEAPGEPFEESWLVPGTPAHTGTEIVEELEAHGGRAFLVVERPGCTSSIVPFDVPGFKQRDSPERIELRVPTCAMIRANTREVPAGPYRFGGLGEPVSKLLSNNVDTTPPERTIDLPAYAIDRTEVTNAEFRLFTAMARWTGIKAPDYPRSVTGFWDIDRPRGPVVGVRWNEARAYCQFLGKKLPTNEQWVKALRGGLTIDGKPNPVPNRNLPWGLPLEPIAASYQMKGGPGDVGSFPRDVSPYGVLDLSGSATEWTDTPADKDNPDYRFRIARGANWNEVSTEGDFNDFVALENPRAEKQIHYGLGLRCVTR